MGAARALFRGSGHVVEAIDDDFGKLIDRLGVIGLPAREAFPGHAPSHAAMDRVFRTGVAEVLTVPSDSGIPGRVVIEPVWVRGQVWGVATQWTPLVAPAPTTATPRPEPALTGRR